jgi:hypothetical protein
MESTLLRIGVVCRDLVLGETLRLDGLKPGECGPGLLWII